MEPTHNFDVQGFEGVTCRLDEVHACVDPVINYVHAIDLVLRLEVCVKALLNVLHDRTPRVVVVDKVTESWSVHNGQTKPDPILLDICTDGLDRDGLWDDVKARAFAFLRRVQGSVEEGVDQG